MAKVIEMEKLESQSIFTILKNRTRTVNILSDGKGKDATRYGLEVTIPEWFPSDVDFESFDDIISHLESFNKNLPLIVLQSGLAQELIQVWSKPKPKAPKKDGTGGEDIHSDDYPEIACKRAFDYMPKVAQRPNTSGTKKVDDARYADCLAMFGTLTASGMDKSQVEEMATAVYGAELVADISKALTK